MSEHSPPMCPNCGDDLHTLGRDEHVIEFCHGCGRVATPCPQCGGDLRMPVPTKELDASVIEVACDNCGFPTMDLREVDGPDPSISNTIKACCEKCGGLFALHKSPVSGETLSRFPRWEPDMFRDSPVMSPEVHYEFFSGACSSCQEQLVVIVDLIDRIVHFADERVADLTRGNVINEIPPPNWPLPNEDSG